MTSAQIILLVVLAVAIATLVYFGLQRQRRRSLRRTFGPEYDRVVAGGDNRAAGERELRGRERRHAELELRPLDPSDRDRYAQGWRTVQEQFVTDPAQAVIAGDALVTRLVAARGYPTGDYEDQLSYLSVEHARTLGRYRDAHEIYLRGERGQASTEELRQAFVHYRELFEELLGEDVTVAPTGAGSAPPAGPEPTRVGSGRVDTTERLENPHD